MLVGEAGLQFPAPASPETIRYALAADGRPADPAAAGVRALTSRARRAGQAPDLGPLFQLSRPVAPDIARPRPTSSATRPATTRTPARRWRRPGTWAMRCGQWRPGWAMSVAEPGVVIDLLLSLRAVERLAGHGRACRPDGRAAGPQHAGAGAIWLRPQPPWGAPTRRGVLEEIIAAPAARAAKPTASLAGFIKIAGMPPGRPATRSKPARWLGKAIATYLQASRPTGGMPFRASTRRHLMELASPPDPRRVELLPVLAYAVKRRIARARPLLGTTPPSSSWPVLAPDEAAARLATADALAAVREQWEPASTARNLGLIREARAGRGEVAALGRRHRGGAAGPGAGPGAGGANVSRTPAAQ